MTDVAPFVIFFAGAAGVALSPARWRAILLVATPVVGAINLWFLDPAATIGASFMGLDLVIHSGDRLSVLFAGLFHLAALTAVIYSLHMSDRLQQVAALAYAGCAVGAVYSGDLVTLFLFWEGLALTSAALILARRTPSAFRATLRYLVVQVTSGMLLLAGVAMLRAGGEDISLTAMELDGTAAWLIFLALGIKCGFPLLHGWIIDAYPEATETGTVLMSAFTTKVAIFALARLFPGTGELIWIGAVMTMFPIFYAVIENDLRRVLAYSMINQLGFMVVGIGIGTELALNGAVSHAVSHVLYKSLLFMTMGAVLYRTGRMGGSELGGLYRTMPATTGLCIVGAASISAFPLFSGFVSKSMILVAAIEEGHGWVWMALLFASAGVFHHAGIKVPFFAFFAHDSGLRPKEAPRAMLVAMAIAASGCLVIGMWPDLLYRMLPWPVHYEPYTWSHVLTQCQLLFFSALAFTLLKLYGLYPPELPGVNVDADWCYRWLLPRLARRAARLAGDVAVPARAAAQALIAGATGVGRRWGGPSGIMARDPLTGTASMVVLFVFALVLVLHLVRGV